MNKIEPLDWVLGRSQKMRSQDPNVTLVLIFSIRDYTGNLVLISAFTDWNGWIAPG